MTLPTTTEAVYDLLAADGLPDTGRIELASRLGRDEWAVTQTSSIFRLTRPSLQPPTP